MLGMPDVRLIYVGHDRLLLTVISSGTREQRSISILCVKNNRLVSLTHDARLLVTNFHQSLPLMRQRLSCL